MQIMQTENEVMSETPIQTGRRIAHELRARACDDWACTAPQCKWIIEAADELLWSVDRETAANEQIKRVREETIELTDDQWIDAQEIYEKAHGPTHGHAEWVDGIEAVLAYIRALKC